MRQNGDCRNQQPLLQRIEDTHPEKEDQELLEVLRDELSEDELMPLEVFQGHALKYGLKAGWEADRTMTAYYQLRYSQSRDPRHKELAEVFSNISERHPKPR